MFQRFQLLLKDLKSFFRCNYYRITKQLLYPHRIIPKQFYKPKIQIQELLEQQQLYVTRRLDTTFEKAFNKHGNEFFLREDALYKDDIPNMSMNLMGGKFVEKDISFSPLINDTGSMSWIHPSKIFLDEYIGRYKIQKDYTSVYFTVLDIHDIPVPYLRPKDKNSDKLAKALANTPQIFGDKYEFYGKALVQHDPTNLNYWHVEYQIIDGNNNKIDKNKSTWHDKFCESLINNLLVANGVPKLNHSIMRIAARWYKN